MGLATGYLSNIVPPTVFSKMSWLPTSVSCYHTFAFVVFAFTFALVITFFSFLMSLSFLSFALSIFTFAGLSDCPSYLFLWPLKLDQPPFA